MRTFQMTMDKDYIYILSLLPIYMASFLFSQSNTVMTQIILNETEVSS